MAERGGGLAHVLVKHEKPTMYWRERTTLTPNYRASAGCCQKQAFYEESSSSPLLLREYKRVSGNCSQIQQLNPHEIP
jgi:hypothetical protein